MCLCFVQGLLSSFWQLSVVAAGAGVLVVAWQQESNKKLPVYNVLEEYGVVSAADELNKTA